MVPRYYTWFVLLCCRRELLCGTGLVESLAWWLVLCYQWTYAYLMNMLVNSVPARFWNCQTNSFCYTCSLFGFSALEVCLVQRPPKNGLLVCLPYLPTQVRVYGSLKVLMLLSPKLLERYLALTLGTSVCSWLEFLTVYLFLLLPYLNQLEDLLRPAHYWYSVVSYLFTLANYLVSTG